jgi:hypothetical protein
VKRKVAVLFGYLGTKYFGLQKQNQEGIISTQPPFLCLFAPAPFFLDLLFFFFFYFSLFSGGSCFGKGVI